MVGALTLEQIRQLVEGKPPLVTSFINLKTQLQPSGMDFTLKEVARFTSSGILTCDNLYRQTSDLEVLAFNEKNQLHLPVGSYLITYNEIINLPLYLMGLVLPRSSLLRSGVTVNTAVWDPGYNGRGQSLLSVSNPNGFVVEENVRIVQMIFLTLNDVTEGYSGAYQMENL